MMFLIVCQWRSLLSLLGSEFVVCTNWGDLM
jgi:hypothetical protein